MDPTDFFPMGKIGKIISVSIALLAVLLALYCGGIFNKSVPSFPEEQPLPLSQTDHLPGFSGVYIFAYTVDPNNGYVSSLNNALQPVLQQCREEGEEVVAVLPARYTASGYLQAIWVVKAPKPATNKRHP